MCNNPKLGLVYMNAYIKFGETMSMCSQDFELISSLYMQVRFIP